MSFEREKFGNYLFLKITVIVKNLLEKDGTVSLHVKNLQKLATAMFKISKNFLYL